NISKEFIEEQYFQNNLSQQEIADLLGVSQWVISQRMKKFGLKPKERTWKIHKPIYSVNHSYFDSLNEENAWVIGWIASDGYVKINGNSYYFGMNLSKKDGEIIDKIKNLLNYNGPIYTRNTYLKKTGKWYEENQLQITSKKIFHTLEKYGIGPNKTDKLDFPSEFRDTHESILKSFIFGFFEGDGSVLFDEKCNSPCFQIVGTREMLEGIQLQLMKYIGVKKTKLTKNSRKSNHYALRYRGRFQAIKIFDWLYLNQKHYLLRKYQKYLDIKRRLNS
ncbi:MAG: hypothetical protein NUV67_01105, partial [archaeon]|nr:hypothetical protein [archaeon]